MESVGPNGYLKDTVIGFSTAVVDRTLVGFELRMPNLRTRQDMLLISCSELVTRHIH